MRFQSVAVLFCAAFAVAVGALYLLQLDDELTPRARAWIAQVEARPEQGAEGYYLLMGLMAAADEDPVIVGRSLAQSWRQAALADPGVGEGSDYRQYPEARMLPRPEGELYCSLHDGLCAAALQAGPMAIAAELERHQVLLQRYLRYSKYTVVRSTVPPRIVAPVPPHRYLVAGSRLNQLRILKLANSGDAAGARQLLRENMARLRGQLPAADDLVHKLILTQIVRADLQLLTYLNRDRGAGAAAPLPRLTAAERSFRLPMMREFGMGAAMYRGLDRHPQFFAQAGEPAGDLPGWVVRLAYKPNMTINEHLPRFQALVGLSEQTREAFYRAVQQRPQEEGRGLLAWLRNPAGAILNDIAAPSLRDSLRRLYDLDCEIQRFNARYAAGAPVGRYCPGEEAAR